MLKFNVIVNLCNYSLLYYFKENDLTFILKKKKHILYKKKINFLNYYTKAFFNEIKLNIL